MRRLRRTPGLRRLVAQTRVHPADLVLPLFVKEGIAEPEPVSSMPGVLQHTVDSARAAARDALDAGVGGVLLFGVPAQKDSRGSSADDPAGIVQQATAAISAEVGGLIAVMTDLCLDEYTDHGHCGILTEPDGKSTVDAPAEVSVDNDATLVRYGEIAVAQARAGADVVAPSGMMDGQVAAIRAALDDAGCTDVAIWAYSAKYSSAFYGPFRDAAECAPRFGDRSTYQQDPANADEALSEVALDLTEGADAVMVKPALSYLDIVARVSAAVEVPIAAYQVSGEYAMVEAAAAAGWIDRDRIIAETILGIRRAGADVVITYWATEFARRLADG